MAPRISALIKKFQNAGFECEKVILVTHSMGGLLARALIHPEYGGLKDKVLGMVHGVMPAIGSGAGYKRIRAGFEDPGLFSRDPKASAGAKVAGNYGDEVTAVLANAPGGLQLLPSRAYGNGWLQIRHNEKTLDAWPKRSDPYDEIYKVKGKWYSLIKEDWVNPARDPKATFKRTCQYLDDACVFHSKITDTYHEVSYGHYGVDPEKLSFGDVVWDISTTLDVQGWENWSIKTDYRQGMLMLTAEAVPRLASTNQAAEAMDGSAAFVSRLQGGRRKPMILANILPPTERGDQTVPIRSADHQLQSGKFKAIFRQRGYDHQGSYQNPIALASTLFSIVRIAQLAKWKGQV